jgi:hypothetical protein
MERGTSDERRVYDHVKKVERTVVESDGRWEMGKPGSTYRLPQRR